MDHKQPSRKYFVSVTRVTQINCENIAKDFFSFFVGWAIQDVFLLPHVPFAKDF